jgi:CrcB protein
VTLDVVALVALGAVVGAPVRFLVERRLHGAYPWGTFLVNVVGSAVLGGLVAASVAGGLDERWVVLVGTGFCGALTTFGGFGAQVLDLATAPPASPAADRARAAASYALTSVVVCVSAAALVYVTVMSLLR